MLIAVRKAGALFPGEKHSIVTEPDYGGRTTELMIRQDHVRPGDHLLLVDDWIETGRQAVAAKLLVERCGGQLAAVSVLVDQLSDADRPGLPLVSSILTEDELPTN